MQLVLAALLALGLHAEASRTAARAGTKDSAGADDTEIQYLEDAKDPPPEVAGPTPDGLEEDLVAKEAQSRNAIMKQFMKNFATNMRKAVLEDSEGDMPEDQRRKMLLEIGDNAAPQGSDADADVEAPPRRLHRRAHHRHMLNGGRRVRDVALSEVHEQPEVSYQPPPEERQDIAQDASEEQAVQEAPPPRPHRRHHHATMLNARKHGRRNARATQASDAAAAEASDDEDAQPRARGGDDEDASSAPRRVGGRLAVTDEMGRKMPLLFGGEPAAPKSAASGTGLAVLIVGSVLLMH